MANQKILRLYEQIDNTELEFRFQMKSRDIFKKMIPNISGDKTVEQSIAFISPGFEGDRRCEIIFVNGVKKTVTYGTKTSIERGRIIEGTVPYKIVLSKEEKIDKFDINLSKIARIKLRMSVRPDQIEGWRVDFTLIKTVHNISQNIKRDKTAMFGHITPQNFIENAPWTYADSLELEVEHVGRDKHIVQKDIDTVAEYIYTSIDPKHKNLYEYQKHIYSIASFIVDKKHLEQFKQRRGIRDLYNRVWELSKCVYYKSVFPNLRKHYLLDKADGVRTLLKIEGNTLYVLDGKMVAHKLAANHPGISVFDSEFVEETGKFHVFDVIAFNGKNVANMPTSNRIEFIPALVKMTEGRAVEKKMVLLTSNYREEISDMWRTATSSEKKYEVDGLIFTPAGETYRAMKSWKWKPLDYMSIDFLVKKPPRGLSGLFPYIPKDGHVMLFLFSGIQKPVFDKLRLTTISGYNKLFPHQNMHKNFPIQFSPSDNPYAYIYYHPVDSKFDEKTILDNVCEFRRILSGTESKWDLMRIRDDRKTELDKGNYFGNGFYVAEYTWQNYQNPLLFDDLIISSSEFMDRGYFQEEKSRIYKSATAFNSFVKRILLSKFKGSNWLIDLAAGQGQDMFRVSDAKMNNALFIDSDPQALSELVSRKHDFQRGIKRLHTRIFTKLADLTSDYRLIVESMNLIGVPVGEVDVIMCNFAIHYLIGTTENISNLIGLIKTMLKPNGHFFFTAFDGKKIFELLGNRQSWNSREGDTLKYSIKKKYASGKLGATGQQIEVLLPFSGGNFYTEFLVNFEYIISEFNSNGFSVEKHGGFSKFLPLFREDNAKLFAGISRQDAEFLSLYSYCIVKKNTV